MCKKINNNNKNIFKDRAKHTLSPLAVYWTTLLWIFYLLVFYPSKTPQNNLNKSAYDVDWQTIISSNGLKNSHSNSQELTLNPVKTNITFIYFIYLTTHLLILVNIISA